jgi:predicted SAM-dependent methyltransferase
MIRMENVKEVKLVKLHIGCGTNYFNGWTNLDNNSDNNITKVDISHDMRNPLPFGDSTVDFIYNEHFLEHLTVGDGQKVIRDFMRVLKTGGVLRISVPDLAKTVDKYLHVGLKDDPVVIRFGLSHIKTRAERINMAFRAWGHKWLYDQEELERRLREAGCTNIKKCDFMRSEYRELTNIETRDESSLIMEVVK